MSKVQLYYHIVFATKMRQKLLNPDKERLLFSYIMGIMNNLGAKLIRINAAMNHVHILASIPPTISISDLVGTVKRSSSLYISSSGIYPKFWGWAKEYYAESVSPGNVEKVKDYIMNQKEHHNLVNFEDEWLEMLPEKERARWEWRYMDE